MTLAAAADRLSIIAGKPIRAFATRDFGRDRNTAARSVIVSDEDAVQIAAELRRVIEPGLLAFVGCTHSLAEPPDDGTEVVIAIGVTQFDILRVAASDAVNYDLDTEDLIRKLQEYDAKYGIEIFHAETDIIEFRFKSLPDDLTAFCNDLYQFCPDIVDQGVGSVEELEKAVAMTGIVYLWWD